MDPLEVGLGRVLIGLAQAIGQHELLALQLKTENESLKAQLEPTLKENESLKNAARALSVRVEELTIQKDKALASRG